MSNEKKLKQLIKKKKLSLLTWKAIAAQEQQIENKQRALNHCIELEAYISKLETKLKEI